MPLEILSTREATRTEWETTWERCDYATFFHSPLWAEAWRDATNGKVRPCPLHVDFSDQTSAIVALTSRSSRLGLVKHHQSSYFGTYGGWISQAALGAPHAALLRSLMTTRHRRLAWRVNPIDPIALASVAGRGNDDETQMLDLGDGFEEILRGWTKGHRSAARRGRREGVEIRMARDLDDWREYYSIYLDSVRRWGTAARTVHPWPLFQALAAQDSTRIKLWLASWDGKIVCGAITFHSMRHVVYWHGAALESSFHLQPVHWLLHEVIRSACEEGYRWFDFNPSGGLEGVRKFKRGFGALPHPAPMLNTALDPS